MTLNTIFKVIRLSGTSPKPYFLIYFIYSKLKGVSEEILIIGSVAFGANYSVNHNSDLDLLVIIKRKNCKKLLKIFREDVFLEEAIFLMDKGKIENFTLDLEITKIKVQLHFWEEKAHKKARLLKMPEFRRLLGLRKKSSFPHLILGEISILFLENQRNIGNGISK